MIRILLVDYSKVFDRVDHSLLLQKISNSRVHDCVTRWFAEAKNQIENAVSEWSSINPGGPQGTLFGSVGFVINDLRTCLPTYKYVDDSTVWDGKCIPCQLARVGGRLVKRQPDGGTYLHQELIACEIRSI